VIVIYHNPRCGTSRNVLAALEAIGAAPVVIDYLQAGWTRAQLLGLFAAADVTVRQALREKDTPAEKLGLLDPAVDDEALLTAMIQHPVLVNRPFVCGPKGVRLCRPSERILELVDVPAGVTLNKEDGSPLPNAKA
jgi:arsenate reductase